MPALFSQRAEQSSQRRAPGAAETVAVRGLVKSFETTSALQGVDLDVPAGSIVSLLGPSGCGKTTLLRCIAGLDRPDRGEVVIGNRLLTGHETFIAPERRHVGMVFQDWALFPHLTVARNVGFGLGRRGRSAQVQESLELVGLADLARRRPETLSGGQQQRVALARALAHRPSVILLDEPFSNLDSTLRNQIRLEVRRVLRELEVTALFVTHDQEEAFVLGDEVAVMFDGVVVQQTSPAELYRTPATRRVAEFIGDGNFLPGIAKGSYAETPIGSVPLRSELIGAVDVLLRPEQLTLRAGRGATVHGVEFYGHDAVYILRAGESTVRVRVIAAPEFSAGDQVDVSCTGDAAVAFPRGAADQQGADQIPSPAVAAAAAGARGGGADAAALAGLIQRR